MDDYVRITRTVAETGETVSSVVLAESLPVWLEVGWELAPDFLVEDEAGPEIAEDTSNFADWLDAIGGDLPAEETPDEEPVPDENPESVDETLTTESSQSTDPAEEN